MSNPISLLPVLIITAIFVVLIINKRRGTDTPHKENRTTNKGIIETGARSDRQLYIILCLLTLGVSFCLRLIITEAIRQAQIKSE